MAMKKPVSLGGGFYVFMRWIFAGDDAVYFGRI